MCRSGCLTRDHKSWGECARAARLNVGSVENGRYAAWDKEMNDYASAVGQGIQPHTTRQRDIDEAVSLANEIGEAI